jgi:hypothetical protein
MGLEQFIEADETYLDKESAIEYLKQKFKIPAHIARASVVSATSGGFKNFTLDFSNDLAEYELTINDLDELGISIQQTDEDTVLNQIKKQRKVVQKGDVYVSGYDSELMDEWSDIQIMSHVYFMKFIAPFNNTNIWVYEEIRLSDDLKYTSVTKERTTFPITEVFVNAYRKIDDFGLWISKSNEAFKLNKANAIKLQNMGNLEKALSMKKYEENIPLEVFDMIKLYLVRGIGNVKEIMKLYYIMKK